MSGVTPEGFDIETAEVIQAAIEADIRAVPELGASINLSSQSALGQVVAIFSRQMAKVWEKLGQVYDSFDPASAEGLALASLSAITGTVPRAATKARLGVTVNVDPGTYLAGTLIINPENQPNDTFTNVEDITNGTGGADDIAGVFDAETAGLSELSLSTVMEITSAVTGFNSITSLDSVTNGLDVETTEELRVRRQDELALGGSATVDGIRADLLVGLAGSVISVTVVENDTHGTVDGIPEHAFEAVIYGPVPPTTEDDQAAADIIGPNKGAGIQAYGSTVKTWTDAQGVAHNIGLTRPSEVDIEVDFAGLVTDDDYINTGSHVELRTFVRDKWDAIAAPDLDAYSATMVCFAKEFPGVLNVSATVDLQGAGPSGSVVAATIREILALDITDVTVS